MRPFFLLRLRARADLSFAFWPGGIKNACFFASLIISSVITLRLNRRRALSIDSPWLTLTIAILSPFLLLIHPTFLGDLFNTPRTLRVKWPHCECKRPKVQHSISEAVSFDIERRTLDLFVPQLLSRPGVKPLRFQLREPQPSCG